VPAVVLVLVGPVADFLADDLLPRARAQALNRMHRLFLELVPGGAPVKKVRQPVQGAAGRRPAP